MQLNDRQPIKCINHVMIKTQEKNLAVHEYGRNRHTEQVLNWFDKLSLFCKKKQTSEVSVGF